MQTQGGSKCWQVVRDWTVQTLQKTYKSSILGPGSCIGEWWASSGVAAAAEVWLLQKAEVLQCQSFDSELAGRHKREGDEAFVGKRFAEAEAAYSNSLEHDPSNHLVWANRSAARLRQGRADKALQDAQRSRELNPKYMKVRLQVLLPLLS